MTIAEKLGIAKMPYRILTLDGGGVRGIITVTWLERLEKHLGGPLYAHFDLIAGTSIGAVIGCAIAKGMTAAEIREIWRDAAAQAFHAPKNVQDRIRGVCSKAGFAPKYGDYGITTMLKSIFGEKPMSALGVKPTLALSYNPQTQRVHIFSSALEEHSDLPIWEVCRASTAAPLFFSPHHMVVCEKSGKKAPLLDGGVTANNPVVIALTKAVEQTRSSGKTASMDHIVVASMGTGCPAEGSTEEARSIFSHGSILLHALMDGATGTDHVTARDLLPAENYWRFQASLPTRLEPLDKVDNLDELAAVAHSHLADGADHRLMQLARRLKGKSLDRHFWERKETAA